jgi:hypothetical protein
VAGSCEHVDERSVLIKSGRITEQLSNYQLLNKYIAPRSENFRVILSCGCGVCERFI